MCANWPAHLVGSPTFREFLQGKTIPLKSGIIRQGKTICLRLIPSQSTDLPAPSRSRYNLSFAHIFRIFPGRPCYAKRMIIPIAIPADPRLLSGTYREKGNEPFCWFHAVSRIAKGLPILKINLGLRSVSALMVVGENDFRSRWG